MAELTLGRTPTERRLITGALFVVGLVVAYLLADHFLPKHLPAGAVAQGVVLGALNSLVAMGLVLVYRSIRVVNFSQATLGGLAAAIAILGVVGWHWSYWVAVPVGIAAAVFTGFLVDLLIQWRFARAPRLIVTVVTIGIALVLGVITIELPNLFAHLSPVTQFKTPFSFKFTIAPFTATGDWLLAVIVVPIVLVGLYWFFVRTDVGVAIRGAADSPDRAQLLGIPVRRLTRITWMVAAGLSGLGLILSQPIQGANLGGSFSVIGGMLVPLAAFVLAGMESLPMAVVWSVVIGVIQWGVYWNYGNFVYSEVALFVLIVVGLFIKRQEQVRVTGTAMGDYVAVREVAPIPERLDRLPQVRWARNGLLLVVAALAVLVPAVLSQSLVNDAIYIVIYGMIAVSMVILSGWAGQISLGQFAFVGIGASLTGAFMIHSGLPWLVALLLAGLISAVVASLVGLPALRLPGLSLAVVTAAFAVIVSDWLTSSEYFPGLNPQRVAPPVLFGRLNLADLNTRYLVYLVFLLAAIAIAVNLRRTRTARAIMAVRDNSRAASAYGISPLRAKMLAFAFSGFLAGVAGSLYLNQIGGITSNSFVPDQSVFVFIMVVIGGLGSLTGGLIGAIYLETVQTVLPTNWQYVATGAGVLVVLCFIPEGLGAVWFWIRDAYVRAVARRHQLTPAGEPLGPVEAEAAPDLAAAAGTAPVPAAMAEPSAEAAHTAALRLGALEDLERLGVGEGGAAANPDAGPPGGKQAVVGLSHVDAAYGQTQVLFDVAMGVAQKEIVALLGTNGAGKTTVLRTISGLMSPRKGRIGFLGEDVTDLSPVKRVQAGLVTVLGGRGIFPSLTVEENLRLASWTARRFLGDQEFARAATERVLALFPQLRARAHQRAGLLSGGEQQMLALGQALLCRPKMLLIDELSLGLAPTVVADLLEVVRALAASGVTIIVVEQSVNVATAISNRAIFMERGRVRFSGPTPDLSQQPQLLRSVFLRAAERARARKEAAADTNRAAAHAPVDEPERADDVFAALTTGVAPDPDESGAADAPPTPPPGFDAPAPGGAPPAPPGFTPAVAAIAAPVEAPAAAFACRGVSRSYGGVAALTDVSLEVAPGEILGIIGSNGAGKTTLFDVCSGFVRPDRGRVFMNGQDVTDLSPSRRGSRGLGRLFQDARLWPSMTVQEALSTALEQFTPVRDPVLAALGANAVVRSEEAVAIRVEELLYELGLTRFRDNFIMELSTGTRRVAELGCALAHDPRVLLLDEPTSGIAQRESEALGELIVGLRDQTGAAFIVIEHDVPLVSSIADRMICMHLGEIIAEGETTDVLGNPAVVAAYLGADAAAAARSGPLPPKAGQPGAPQAVAG
jgi:ABC-type branched-subunit amino acid transport system ATPase component/ABC-type branched-subunit amino acid transport system permease subunit